MRRIAAQLLRDHEVAVPRLVTLGLPAPDAPPELVRAGCPRLLDCAAAAACSTSAPDVGQRRGMRLAGTNQRLSPSHTPCDTPNSATTKDGGHASWSQRPIFSPMQQHQQQRGIRLFEVRRRRARSELPCMAHAHAVHMYMPFPGHAHASARVCCSEVTTAAHQCSSARSES